MTKGILQSAEAMEARIHAASGAGRMSLQPEFHRLLEELKQAGTPVPRRMQRLDAVLLDELLEDQFDNMPV